MKKVEDKAKTIIELQKMLKADYLAFDKKVMHQDDALTYQEWLEECHTSSVMNMRLIYGWVITHDRYGDLMYEKVQK